MIGGDTALPLFRMKAINCKPWGDGCLTAAARHNKRSISDSESSIDANRTQLNHTLLGSPGDPDGVVARAERLMAEAGYKPPRNDATIAAEAVFSLPCADSVSDLDAYFADCAEWLASNLSGELLSADVHLDEERPHCHVLVLLPLVAGGPSGSELIGYKQKLTVRRAAFQRNVAAKHGLRPPPALSKTEKQAIGLSVHQWIRDAQDPCMHSLLWPWIASRIDHDPEGAARAIGLQGPTGPATLAVLARTTGKGPRTAAAELAQEARLAASEGPMGVGPDAYRGLADPVRDGHLSCVGVASFLSNPALSLTADPDTGELLQPAPLPDPPDRSRSPADPVRRGSYHPNPSERPQPVLEAA